VVHPSDGVNDIHPTFSATKVPQASRVRTMGQAFSGTSLTGPAAGPPERTLVDVRIGVTQAPREINIELADDADRAAIKAQVEAALSGAVDVLWITDKKGRDVGVCAAKIAYVEVGTPEGERRIGFGG